MRVRVLFFGTLKDMVGRSQEVLELPSGAKVSDVLEHYVGGTPRLQPYLPSLAISLNREYARRDAALADNDEVALLPPVSGGSETPAPAKVHTSLVRARISTEQVMQTIKQGSDGALTVFEGIVRDNSRGRRTLYLDYEGYELMAATELEKLATEALGRFAIRDIAIVHRLGRLEIGETSVLIAVASAHRAAGFDACRWTIDRLKKTVPIWKKEHFADGAVWADGEPFPTEIASAGGERSNSE